MVQAFAEKFLSEYHAVPHVPRCKVEQLYVFNSKQSWGVAELTGGFCVANFMAEFTYNGKIMAQDMRHGEGYFHIWSATREREWDDMPGRSIAPTYGAYPLGTRREALRYYYQRQTGRSS